MSRQGCGLLSTVYLILASLGLWLLLESPGRQGAWAQERFLTQHTEILYHNPGDLQEMEQRLRFTPLDRSYQGYFYNQDRSRGTWSSPLAEKVDVLLTKVCLIIKIWPQKSVRLRIILLPDGDQVRNRYLVLKPFLPESHCLGGSCPASFYEHRTRTIFLSLEDLRQGILAHEMTHFVLCNSFAVPPPPDLQEEWARYVEAMID